MELEDSESDMEPTNLELITRVNEVAKEDLETLPPLGNWFTKVVSIEEATEGIPIPDIKNFVETAKNNAKLLKVETNLTLDEIAAVILYTIEWPERSQSLYYQLNKCLRDADRGSVVPFFKYLVLLLSGLSKIPPFEGMVYRGVQEDLCKLYQSKKDENLPIVWNGLSSSTMKLGVLQTFIGNSGHGTMFHIQSKSARKISDFSIYQREDEALFFPLSQFEIDSLFVHGDLTMVSLREVDPIEKLETLFTNITLGGSSPSIGVVPNTTSPMASTITPLQTIEKGEEDESPRTPTNKPHRDLWKLEKSAQLSRKNYHSIYFIVIDITKLQFKFRGYFLSLAGALARYRLCDPPVILLVVQDFKFKVYNYKRIKDGVDYLLLLNGLLNELIGELYEILKSPEDNLVHGTAVSVPTSMPPEGSRHWAIFDSEQNVFWEYQTPKNILIPSFDSGEVMATPFDEFLKRVKNDYWIEFVPHLTTPNESIHRARQKISQKNYSPIRNNCECFVREVMTGEKESRQVIAVGNFLHKIAQFFSLKKWTVLEKHQIDFHGYYMIIGDKLKFGGIYETYIECKNACVKYESGCIIRCHKGLQVVSIFTSHERFVTEWETYFESLTDLLMSLHWKIISLKYVLDENHHDKLKLNPLNDLLLPWKKSEHISWTRKSSLEPLFDFSELDPSSGEFTAVCKLFYEYMNGNVLRIKKIFAIHNPTLLQAFNEYKSNLAHRFRVDRKKFLKSWQKVSDPKTLQLKEGIHNDYKNYCKKFIWNEGEELLPIVPVAHGLDLELAWEICQSGFASLATFDEGYYGRGIYSTTHGVYTKHYIQNEKNPAMLISFVLPGNIYPVTESHPGDDSLIGKPIKSGFQSHYVLVKSDREIRSHYYNELVIDQEAQILPGFLFQINDR